MIRGHRTLLHALCALLHTGSPRLPFYLSLNRLPISWRAARNANAPVLCAPRRRYRAVTALFWTEGAWTAGTTPWRGAKMSDV